MGKSLNEKDKKPRWQGSEMNEGKNSKKEDEKVNTSSSTWDIFPLVSSAQ